MDLKFALLSFALVVPAIVFHEVSHGYVAYLLGDTTAKDAGRLSLNPLKHIDPFGTIILPILLIAVAGFGFGYAKPVPVNPYRFSDYRKGMFLTGIAGPATNLVLAAISGLIVRVIGADQGLVSLAFFMFAQVNLVLLFFNLIPIPPLDGSRVIPLFLSDRAMQTYHQVEQYGFIIVLGVLWGVPYVFNVDPISTYFQYTVVPLMRLFTGMA